MQQSVGQVSNLTAWLELGRQAASLTYVIIAFFLAEHGGIIPHLLPP
jgi:hypothetical protein